VHLHRGAVLLSPGYTEWSCPACGLSDRTGPLPPNAARFHPCPALHSLAAPLIRGPADCKTEATLRADYAGTEILTVGDDGRPWMNVTTTHADGHTDVAVFAPLAAASLRT
jgi:hypothetical protein